jgi:hypothetical protein
MWRKWPEQHSSVSSSNSRDRRRQARKYLDVPVALAKGLQAKLLRNFGSRHGVGQILLVAEHEKNGIAQLVLVQHALQLIARLADTFPAHQGSNNSAKRKCMHMQEEQRAGELRGKHLSLLSTTKIRPCVF